MRRLLKVTYEWLIDRPGYVLLTGSDERLRSATPQRFRLAWIDVMVLSLLWGLFLIGLWSAAWAIFRDYGLIVLPGMVTLSVMVLWGLRRSVVSLGDILGGRNPTGRATAVSLLVVVLAFLLVRIDARPEYEPRLPWIIAWMCPDYKIYRVLLLMGLWGGWSMMVTPLFCQPNEQTEPAIAVMATGCGALTTAACMGIIFAWSSMYFSYLPWTQLSISAVTALGGIVGGIVLCKASGGLNRKALLGTNFLTQIIFVLGYLANSG